MNILSLFDGISCAYVALKRTGIPIQNYYACEIDKYAIQVSKANHPQIVHLGSVVDLTPIPNLDLLIGGSPCQDLSIAKKDRKGLDGERSSLFWEYVRIWKESNPKYFILENVASMPKDAKAKITEIMGVEPIMINASLVSAQSRKRLFWTNIPVNGLPEDRNIFVKDILLSGEHVIVTNQIKYKPGGDKTQTLLARDYKGFGNQAMSGVKFTPSKNKFTSTTRKLGFIGEKDHQATRLYDTEGKAPALNTICNNGLIKIGREIGRHLNEEGKREDKPEIPITRRIEIRTDDKSGTLTSATKDNLVVGEQIRKLDPIECERLQGLPDNYTECISNTQRYKCLGNAFNVDVICHILNFIKEI